MLEVHHLSLRNLSKFHPKQSEYIKVSFCDERFMTNDEV